MNLQEILSDIHALEEELLVFERKYGIRSETFYVAYVSGEEPEDDSWVLDFSLWAGLYEIKLERERMFRAAVAQEKSPLRIVQRAPSPMPA